jgi:hypothetical protein
MFFQCNSATHPSQQDIPPQSQWLDGPEVVSIRQVEHPQRACLVGMNPVNLGVLLGLDQNQPSRNGGKARTPGSDDTLDEMRILTEQSHWDRVRTAGRAGRVFQAWPPGRGLTLPGRALRPVTGGELGSAAGFWAVGEPQGTGTGPARSAHRLGAQIGAPG